MRAQIAQLAALVMHGNARLDYGHEPGDFAGHSAAEMCSSILFCDATQRAMPVVAESIPEWFETHDASGTLYLQLHYHPASKLMVGDRMLAGFINSGGRWLIEQCHGFRSDVWESNWEPIGHRWNVEYGRIHAASPASPLDTEPLEPLAEQLLDVLDKLAAFATKNDLTDFAERFTRAAEHLDSADPPEPAMYPDLAPVGLLQHDARRILATIDEAWVFTAEDSWNDVALHTRPHDYEPLSNELYRLLTRGLCAVANSTAIPLARGRR